MFLFNQLLDYCDSLFLCMSILSLDHLQMVQNAAVRLLKGPPKIGPM